jgi:hypothetical protein
MPWLSAKAGKKSSTNTTLVELLAKRFLNDDGARRPSYREGLITDDNSLRISF